MYWLQAYASFVPHKSSNGIRYNKKVSRIHDMSADHSSRYPEARLPAIHSANNFSANRYATPGLYLIDTLLTKNIGGS
ncbi:MAG: hypothetical protein AMJ53_15990 [Gammaproteobacteria bacterium SG8_11]|nr:MAG: hypothetical protein AMJ53_15990 [Gammaproteobacteria bacterium SG8_11]